MSKQQLTDIFTNATSESIDKYYRSLHNCVDRYEINTVPRVSHFLAHINKVSKNLTYNQEITTKWKCRKYIGKYGNSWFLFSADSYKYRGRGLLHLVGKKNYKKYSDYIGFNFEKYPDKLLDFPYCVDVAGFIWTRLKNLNAIADLGYMKCEKKYDVNCDHKCRFVNECIHAIITKELYGGYEELAKTRHTLLRAYKAFSF